MNAQIALTSADLDRGRAAAETELQEAREEHARCAYQHARDRNDPAARDALIQSKQRLDLLDAEIQGLEAATGEATRLEKLAELNAAIAKLDADRDRALQSVDAVEQAFGRIAKVVKQLKAANAELEAAEAAANAQESSCARLPHGHTLYSQNLRTSALLDALLWWALGDRELQRTELVMDIGGTVDIDHPARCLKRQSERSRVAINEGIERKATALREQAEGIVRAAPVDNFGLPHETLRLARRVY